VWYIGPFRLEIVESLTPRKRIVLRKALANAELRAGTPIAFALVPRSSEGVTEMEDQFDVDIRQLRRNLRMTQEEFAHTLGITVATVNRWENGHAKPSKLARRALERLAQARSPEPAVASF